MIVYFYNELPQTLLYILLNNLSNCCYYLARHVLCLINVFVADKTNRNGTGMAAASLMLVRLVLYVLGWVVNTAPTPLQSSVLISQCLYLLASKIWTRFYIFITRGARGDFCVFYKFVFSVCAELLLSEYSKHQTRGMPAWTHA